MWSFTRSSARAHRASMLGSLVIVLLASALLSATGVLMESGIRGSGLDPSSSATLTAVAASFAGTTVLVVVLMVASTIAAALRQRRREFALLRAVGATGAQVRSMVTGEVLLIFAVGGLLGAVPGLAAARLLTPMLVSSGIVPAGYDLTLSPLPVIATLLLLVPTGLLAARLAGREAVRTSPTAAVRVSDAEPSVLGRGRRITAGCLAVAGLAVALVPFVIPGMLGGAAGATSALLLISAAALAGPALVAVAAERAVRASRLTRSASGHLAMVNARGFSRRLTTAIVPLALLLALGTVQSGVDKTAVQAAGVQLEDGVRADLVVDASSLSAGQLDEIQALPGVDAATSTAQTAVHIKIEADDEDLSAFDGLSWEAGALGVLSTGASDVIDPQVRSGSLADVDGVDTIAVGVDATFMTGKGVGDTMEVRYADGTEVTTTIVAVYDRGLGFGDFLVGESTAAAHGAPVAADALYVRSEPGAADDVRASLDAMGLQTQSVDGYIEEMMTTAADGQSLSTVLLLALLAFIALAAANTLAMLSAQRGGEFSLLRRTGATGRQLTAMVAVESAFVVAAAWAIGTLAVVPALVGVSYGLLGTVVPSVDWTTYGGLAAAVAVIAVLAVVPVAVRVGAGRRRA